MSPRFYLLLLVLGGGLFLIDLALFFYNSKEKFKKLTSSNCNYCGESPSKIKKTDCGGEYKYNGLDRLNSNIGYIESNVVSCCWKCNASKTNMTVNEFKNWIKQVYNYFIGVST